MIVRVVVVDPQPRDPRDDIIVYQVPEHSWELLLDMLTRVGAEFVELPASARRPRP